MKTWEIVVQYDNIYGPIAIGARVYMTARALQCARALTDTTMWILDIHEVSRVLSIGGVPWDKIPNNYKRYNEEYHCAALVVTKPYTIDNFTLLVI